MRVLITGINGFIGKHLSEKLTERGHKVLGLENKEDGVLNKKLVEQKVRGAEIIVHLAALTSHENIVDRKFETLETNFIGTKNVLDAFIRSKQACKFLFASTGKVYGKIVRLPIAEGHPTNPLNILGKSKLITERLIDFYANEKQEFVIFRIFQVYGPGQKENFLIPAILTQVNSGKKEITLGDINAKRDYVYIDDVIDAFVRAIEKKGKKGLPRLNRGLSIYNICTGIGLSAYDIVKMVGKIKGIKIKIKVNKSLLRQDEMDQEYGSFDKAKKELGWEPRVSLEDGLGRLLVKKARKNNLQAVVLAGGKGTRMQDNYPNTPKLLIPIGKKPFLDNLVNYLMENDCQSVIICTGYLGDKVEDYINKRRYPISVRLSREKGRLLGTGGALNSIEDLIGKDFFLLFGDVYTRINLKKMFTFHKKKKAVITAVIHKSKHPEDSNLVQFNSHGRIIKIFNKPHSKIPKNPYNLAAAYLISKKIKKYLLPKSRYDFELDLLPKLLDENVPIYGYNTDEFIMDIGTPERLAKAKKLLHK